jgi:hypothetical protein
LNDHFNGFGLMVSFDGSMFVGKKRKRRERERTKNKEQTTQKRKSSKRNEKIK